MKILRGRINWRPRFANRPDLELLVDRIPERSEMVFERRDPGLYFAELDGYVQFFAWGGQQDRGYGGTHFPIKLVTGEEVVLKGPWSSNSPAMNAAGFKRSIEAAFTDSAEDYERGYTFFSGHITIELLERSVELIDAGSHYQAQDYEGRPKGKKYPFPAGSKMELLKLGIEPWGSELSVEQLAVVGGNKLTGGETYFEPAVRLPSGELFIKPD